MQNWFLHILYIENYWRIHSLQVRRHLRHLHARMTQKVAVGMVLLLQKMDACVSIFGIKIILSVFEVDLKVIVPVHHLKIGVRNINPLFTLSHFMPLISFCNPWKHQKIRVFPMFSRSIDREQWHQMGQLNLWRGS